MKYPLLIFVLISISNIALCQNEKTNWLKENTIPISSLNDSVDFTDLQPLKKILKNKDIVMLGEGTHGDGSTFEAKNRLIRFLHEELNFNVVIFEGGFYEADFIDKNIARTGNPINIAKYGLFMWPYAKQSRSIFNYIAETKKSKTPMSIAGMDCKVGTGRSSSKYFMLHLGKTLRYLNVDSSIINYSVFNACINKLWKYEMFNKPKGDTLQIFKSDLDNLIDAFSNKVTVDKSMAEFWSQNLRSIKNSLDMTWHFEKFRFHKLLFKLNTLYSTRDIQNADNLQWLIENKYKDQKVIVWAASIHVLHNLQTIKVGGLKSILFNFHDFNNTGDIIWKKYKERTYTIGFTAYEGRKENLTGTKNVTFRNDTKKSIEYQLNQVDQDYLFLDLSEKVLPEWLNTKMKSSICGYGNETSIIPYTVDGIFFFKEMKEAEY